MPRSRRLMPEHPEQRYWEHQPEVFGSVENISDALVCREQHQFLITDPDGNVPYGNRRGLGLYSHDCRHLSVYDFLLDGMRPLVLLSSADAGFAQRQVLGNYRRVQQDRVIGRATIEIVRERTVNHHLYERLQITNFNNFEVTVQPAYFFEADFADIFEIRGHNRVTRGQMSNPEVGTRSIRYRYWGIDGVWRTTTVAFDRDPMSISANDALFELRLGPREQQVLELRIMVDERTPPPADEGHARLRQDYSEWRDSFARITSDNEGYNRVLDRSITDLRMLWTRDGPASGYIAAGTPWYSTLFGRDSLITALQTLPFRSDLARDTLLLLARNQGQSVDNFREEAPGKILHETREDELSCIGELPYHRYYGSVDSTPLFLILAAEYYRWTADDELIDDLMPALNLALHWPQNFGDLDGDGFVEYRTNSPGGLRNQGWKDSEEGIMHEDGTLCSGPVALCEVQGYLFLAYTRLAEMFAARGDLTRAAHLQQAARDLRKRFNKAFWLSGPGYVALALDGSKRPAAVVSSNAGQVLWSGILSRQRAAKVRDALMTPDMFSGWGIRTLSAAGPSYYPLGYHLGTVWPHDNGIVALGFQRYGFQAEVCEVATALFDAARHFPSFRLPELFGGQQREEFQGPVPYPVACRPQAWTAGTQFHLLQAMLGLQADAARGRLWLQRPHLPDWLGRVQIEGLRVGSGEADIVVERRHGRTRARFRTRGGLQAAVISGRSPPPD